MAKLPDAAELGERPTPRPSGAIAQIQPARPNQGPEALHAFSNDMAAASELIARTSERQDQVVAMSATNQLRQAVVDLEQDPEKGYQSVRGNGVVGPKFTTDYLTRLEDTKRSIGDKLTQSQRAAFDRHAEVVGLQFKSGLLQHQSKQTIAFNTTTRESTISLGLADIAAHPFDDATYAQQSVLLGRTVVDAGKDMGLTGEALANWTRAGMQKLQGQALKYRTAGMLKDDPGKASEFYNANILDYDANDRITLGAQIKTAVDARTSDAVGEQAFNLGMGLATKPPPAAPRPGESMPPGAPATSFGTSQGSADFKPLPPSPAPPAPPARPGQRNASTDPRSLTKGQPLEPMPQTRVTEIVDLVRKPSQYDALIAEGAKAFNISPIELKLRLATESSLNPNAKSEQGAIGIAQFMPDTAKAYGIDPTDVKASIFAAAKYMAKFGGTVGNDMSRVDRAYYQGSPDQKSGTPKTDRYVAGLAMVREQLYGPEQRPVTEDLLQASEARVRAIAEAAAEQQRPGDTHYRDQVVGSAMKRLSSAMSEVRGKNQAGTSQIMALFASDKPPQSIGDLPPALQAAYAELPGQTQSAIFSRMKQESKGGPQRNEETQRAFYFFSGLAAEDPEKFASSNLAELIPTMPYEDWNKLNSMQMQLRSKEGKAAIQDIKLTHAMSIAKDALTIINVQTPTKSTSDKNNQAYYEFTGRLGERMKAYQTEHKKVPDDLEIRRMAGELTGTVKVPGRFWGSNDKPVFQLTPEEEASVNFELQPADAKRLNSEFSKTFGRQPDATELKALRIAELLHPTDVDYLRGLHAAIKSRRVLPAAPSRFGTMIAPAPGARSIYDR